ncbi:hypothetical protein FRB91_002611 [Serendipita sp. 411]|nr:hypothetical protein FRB91_002611 [Serendipita sp. 411]
MSNTHSSNAMDDVLPTNRHSGETTAIDTPVPTTLTIWCFIRGEGAPFRVTIARTHIVDDLKKAIYNEKKTLQFTDANLLTLYEINLPIDENLPKIVEDMKLGPLRPLMVTKRLSQVFPAVPKDDTVHILVQLPELAHAMVKDGSGPSSGASGSKHSHSGDIDMGVGESPPAAVWR